MSVTVFSSIVLVRLINCIFWFFATNNVDFKWMYQKCFLNIPNNAHKNYTYMGTYTYILVRDKSGLNSLKTWNKTILFNYGDFILI